MKITEHHKKVFFGALAFGIVLFLVLYFYNQYQLKQAASATAANVDADMTGSASPGYLYAEYLPAGTSSNTTAVDPTSPTLPTTPTVQAYNAASSSTIPVSAWAYNPSFQLYYQVPEPPSGYSVPQVSTTMLNNYVSGIEPA